MCRREESEDIGIPGVLLLRIGGESPDRRGKFHVNPVIGRMALLGLAKTPDQIAEMCIAALVGE